MKTHPVRRRPGRGRPSGATAKSARTRRRIFDAAVRLFATHGFHRTTMRDVARTAGTSVGLAYRYFTVKEGIVLELYRELGRQFAAAAAELPNGTPGDRFVAAMERKLELLAPYRAALRAMAVIGLDPDSPASVLGGATASVRQQSIEVFERLLKPIRMSQPARAASAEILYVIHLAILFCWLQDRSEGQRATHRLIGVVGTLVTAGLRLIRMPGMGSLPEQLANALRPFFESRQQRVPSAPEANRGR